MHNIIQCANHFHLGWRIELSEADDVNNNVNNGAGDVNSDDASGSLVGVYQCTADHIHLLMHAGVAGNGFTFDDDTDCVSSNCIFTTGGPPILTTEITGN